MAIRTEMHFPDIQARSLAGRDVKTSGFLGNPVAFLLGFTYESRFEVESWADFIAKKCESRLTCIEMPVYSGIWVFLRPLVDRQMAAATLPALKNRVFTTRDRDALVRCLDLRAPERAAAIVLTDSDGRVVFLARGARTPESEQAFLAAWQSLSTDQSL